MAPPQHLPLPGSRDSARDPGGVMTTAPSKQEEGVTQNPQPFQPKEAKPPPQEAVLFPSGEDRKWGVGAWKVELSIVSGAATVLRHPGDGSPGLWDRILDTV